MYLKYSNGTKNDYAFLQEIFESVQMDFNFPKMVNKGSDSFIKPVLQWCNATDFSRINLNLHQCK